MTKITLRPDQAAVAAKVIDRYLRRPVHVQPLPPLHDDRALCRELVQAEVSQLRALLHSIEVDVRQLETAWVDTDQLERGARHVRHRPRPLGDAADERRLAGAQLAGQQHDISLSQPLAEQHPGAFGLGRRAGDFVRQSGRSRCSEGPRRSPSRPSPIRGTSLYARRSRSATAAAPSGPVTATDHPASACARESGMVLVRPTTVSDKTAGPSMELMSPPAIASLKRCASSAIPA